jgi:uncharacterized protein YlxW (UPF0749 family)
MSLLVDLSSNSLDPGYAAAAARRVAGAATDRRRIPLLLVGGVLAATAVLVVAAVQARGHAPAATRSRAALVADVERQSRAVAALEVEVNRLRARTEALRDRSLAGSSAGAAITAQVRAAELAAGTLAVTGPGVRVVVSDQRGGEHNRVQDRDLQAVVNALWAAGAEAIAVNGERLTAQSAIRQAGDAILVDLAPVSSPYVVEAVGAPVGLDHGFGVSAAAARMRGYAQLYGLGFRYSRAKALRLPAAAEEPLRFARPVASPSPRSAAP